MISNFRGNAEKEIAYKLNSDNSETKFKFEYYQDESSTGERFLSNLHMVGSTIIIKTHKDLNWLPKDVVLLTKNRTRYKVSSVQKVSKTLSKNFYVGKLKYDYIIVLTA